jgi:hypothetical protein
MWTAAARGGRRYSGERATWERAGDRSVQSGGRRSGDGMPDSKNFGLEAGYDQALVKQSLRRLIKMNADFPNRTRCSGR